jgi:putative sigma-54 modulation protein
MDNIQTVGKGLVFSDAMTAYVSKDLEKVWRKFENPNSLTCRVVAQACKVGAKVEITVWGKNDVIFRAEVKNDDFYAAADLAVDKLLDQVRRFRTRVGRNGTKSMRKAADSIVPDIPDPDEEPEDLGEVVRVKNVDLTPMTIDEAIERMEALGHTFFVYLDSEDDKISVVYKRFDSGYGAIQADNKLA